MKQFNSNVFRANDIRGNADLDFTDEFCIRLGHAFATNLKKPTPTVAVGRDCRLSSPRIARGLILGLTRGGALVSDIGVVPSPTLYFASHHLKTDGAIVVTGSHNPKEDNGFKLLVNNQAIHGPEIQTLRQLMESDLPKVSQGQVSEIDVSEDYLENLCHDIKISDRSIKVVTDCGNGAAGPLLKQAFSRLGINAVHLNNEMDGNFPAHHPDPTVESSLVELRKKVSDVEATIGIALDGDGDRLGVIDHEGNVIWGDMLTLLLAKDVLIAHPGATIVGEVKCSQSMYDGLSALGGNAIMWKVGHSKIKKKMTVENALLGGEMSGHLFFRDRHLGFDDAIYAAARIIELVCKPTWLESIKQLPVTFTTPEIRMECSDDIKTEVVTEVKTFLTNHPSTLSTIDIDGIRAKFENGWGLVRQSNTQPAIIMRFEATNKDELSKIQNLCEEAVRSTTERLSRNH